MKIKVWSCLSTMSLGFCLLIAGGCAYPGYYYDYDDSDYYDYYERTDYYYGYYDYGHGYYHPYHGGGKKRRPKPPKNESLQPWQKPAAPVAPPLAVGRVEPPALPGDQISRPGTPNQRRRAQGSSGTVSGGTVSAPAPAATPKAVGRPVSSGVQRSSVSSTPSSSPAPAPTPRAVPAPAPAPRAVPAPAPAASPPRRVPGGGGNN